MPEHFVFAFTHRGATYQVFRVEWSAETQRHLGRSGGCWEIRLAGEFVCQVSRDQAPTPAAVEVEARRWLDDHAFECRGGPLDGERVGDHGDEFRPSGKREIHYDEDHAASKAYQFHGCYRRVGDTYVWSHE